MLEKPNMLFLAKEATDKDLSSKTQQIHKQTFSWQQIHKKRKYKR